MREERVSDVELLKYVVEEKVEKGLKQYSRYLRQSTAQRAAGWRHLPPFQSILKLCFAESALSSVAFFSTFPTPICPYLFLYPPSLPASSPSH